MEPEGEPLTPGTNYGPPPSTPTTQNHTLQQASCSPNGGEELMRSRSPWSDSGDGVLEQTKGPLARPDPGRTAQRTFRPSAFPSSLAWDSDSEKETLDDEELQHFSNPHGLAAHSPGSPSSGLRLESEGDQAPEQLQPSRSDSDKPSLVEGQSQNDGSTHTEDPNAAQLSATEPADGKAWNVSESSAEPLLPPTKVQPKEGCQIAEEDSDEERGGNDNYVKTQGGSDAKDSERDVYTFPGDSDPESPPPAPWAHCTFIQRRRKKRALLRPFSGLGTWQRTLPEAGRRVRGPPQRSPPAAEAAQLGGDAGGGGYDFEEMDLRAEVASGPVKLEEEGVLGEEGGERGQEEEEAPGKEIFTCVECSIYFKKQVHLQEHMTEHCQSGSGAGGSAGRRDRLAKSVRFRCAECGWNLPNGLALADHHRKHQESREKILEEIGKLNDTGKVAESQREESVAVEPLAQQVPPAPAKGPDTDLVSTPVRSPGPVATLDLDADAVLDSESAPTPLPTPARPRAGPTHRRRFVCAKCNFSTRTSQALANHTKTHNRKPPPVPPHASPDLQTRFPSVASALRPGSPSGLASTSLARGHLKQHQNTAHPVLPSVSGVWPDDMGQRSRSSTDPAFSNSFPDSEHLSGSGSSLPEGKSRHGVAAAEDSVLEHQKPNVAAARPARELAFKCIGNRKANKREGDWNELVQLRPRQGSNRLSEGGSTPQEGQRTPLDSELSLKHTDSPAGLRPHTRARSNLDGSSLAQQSGTSSPEEKKVKEEEDSEAESEDAKVYILRRSSRVLAASAENDNDDNDGDDDDIDDERLRRFLAEEGILDEDEDDFDQESETGSMKSVERKCPYCPDRFHNGIGLANHVRGHLNRVGVSYNVRHFISPEEVNAIEKKFSYQKKKKKVANFDPDTFSVMRCEFCSAGFDTRAGLSSHARAHLRDFGITNWEVTISPIHILRELFSSRPDLVIPTSPPRSPGSHRALRGEEEEGEGEEEEEEEEEGEEEGEEETGTEQDKKERADGKRGGERSRRARSAAVSASPRPWRSENHAEGPREAQEEGVEEEEEEEVVEERIPSVDGLSSSAGTKGPFSQDPDHPSPRDEDDADTKVPDLLKCAVCGAKFETRRGLSSHARSHLRQLGISVSESSGAPIDLLYQIAKERGMDGHFTPPLAPPRPSSAKNPTTMHKNEEAEPRDADFDEKPIPLSVLAKAVKSASSSSSTPTPCPSPGGVSPRPPSAPLRPGSPSPVVRKAPISSLLPARSSSDHKAGGIKSLTSIASTKPFWAPQESDAPLNLTLEVDPNKDIICQLCGAWFETRKGLSSHARAHLRHFGVEYSESKGSPIDLLNQLIHTDDFKHNVNTLQADGPAAETQGLATALASPKRPSSLLASASSPLLYKIATARGGSPSKATSSSASSLLGHPPTKRPKSSAMQVFRLSSGELMALPHSEPPKEIGCEFCGEYFENRKGLSSHARSHLRQMGITEWSVNGSPIDTLREVITRRGLPCALPLKPHNSRHKTPPPPSSAAAAAASSARSPPPLSSSSSPSPAALLGRLPFGFARPSSPPPHPTASASKPGSSSSPSGGLVVKMKPEPVQLEVTMSPGGSGGGRASVPLNCSWSGQDSVFPLNLAMTHEAEPTRDIRCEFCGEYFENRKGLSSHARSHLRQMGITEWSVNGSPIDTLREIMHKREGRGGGTSSPSDQRVKKESGQGVGIPAWESLEGQRASSYQLAKYRKSPLSLLHSGSRLHKQGLGGLSGPSANPTSGKFFRVSQLGKRPLSEDGHPAETAQSPSHHIKTFSPLPHDFSFKRKSSPDKHGTGHQDASCELCGFYFENRKALASHARAHLRQFGVTEWCVNGSPIETLSAWMRSRPQKVVEMHRSYMQGNRSTPKKKSSSPLSPTSDPDHILSLSSHKPSSSSSSGHWSAVALSLVRPLGHDASQGSSKATEAGGGGGGAGSTLQVPSSATRPGHGRIPSTLPPQAQVARSELNVRLPRGFERRPLKHGEERDSGSPKPPRTSTIPSLVPKPPSYPLVKLVGKFYTLKCRFCEVEFHGPLSVQEDWIRHLQQHILKMNYNKPAAPKAPPLSAAAAAEEQEPPKAPALPAPASTSTSTSTSGSSSASTTTVLTSSPAPTPPLGASAPALALALALAAPAPPGSPPSPTPLAESAPAAARTVVAAEERALLTPPTLTAISAPTPTAAIIPAPAV